ncbi:hypothetical protein [Paenibacillus donghaensis]|uniref:Uncharacterized protein n=1 Tax=Paenibacillus donghaensis TaxID=414771 RepID=A0A2Z2KP07_9BACL|nr:hypothetical protein [Paenibacillus donghaensis]ASA21901.1 hypothetical protein B9T62_14620 [Paenibacillus donghaensis]
MDIRIVQIEQLNVAAYNPMVSFTATSGADIDIIPYRSKDDSGRVNRGQFHEIKITPNNLGRVVATVVSQLFVQSRGKAIIE